MIARFRETTVEIHSAMIFVAFYAVAVFAILLSASCAEQTPKPQHPYPLCESQRALPRTPDPRRDYQVLTVE